MGQPGGQRAFRSQLFFLLVLHHAAHNRSPFHTGHPQGKGGKNRRRGKNENEETKRQLEFKEPGQEYAQVAKSDCRSRSSSAPASAPATAGRRRRCCAPATLLSPHATYSRRHHRRLCTSPSLSSPHLLLLPPGAETNERQVVRMLGNGRCECYCFDGKTRLGHIRGKMRKKVRSLCFSMRWLLGMAGMAGLQERFCERENLRWRNSVSPHGYHRVEDQRWAGAEQI